MYINPQVLDKKQHRDLKFKPVNDFSFAAQTVSVPLLWDEISAAARCCPIVFPLAETPDKAVMPQALLSLVAGHNAFVSDKGAWEAGCYVPAHVRRYPFMLAEVKKGQFAVMIDMESPQVKKRGGDPLFDEDGKPQALLRKVQVFLKKSQTGVNQTADIVRQLQEADVLVPYRFTVGPKQAPKNIRGFSVVDMKKVKALSDEVLARWVREGVMALIMAHLNSLERVMDLVRRQEALLAEK